MKLAALCEVGASLMEASHFRDEQIREGTMAHKNKVSLLVKNRMIALLAFIVSFSLVGCDQGFDLTKRDVNSENVGGGSDEDDILTRDFPPGSDDDDTADQSFNDPADDDPVVDACDTSDALVESAQLTPDSISGANIVFLIDDSGSMANEFQKVVWELREFIDGITSATGNNYRIMLVFDKDKAAIRNRSFYRDLAKTDLIDDPNPFVDQIADPNVFYIEKETWSKHSDIALYQAFGNAGAFQSLPAVLPVDQPWSLPSITLGDCNLAGEYFRPRHNVSDYGVGTLGCYSTEDDGRLGNYLLGDFVVNIVSISDDDLNVNFDRANFDFDVPAMDAYPEVTDLMIRDVVSDLGEGTGYQWHSIVGPVGSQSGSGIDKDGIAHLALSKRTSGAVYDIREDDWQPLFSNLQEQIIYSEQRVSLSCEPKSENIQVKLNGTPVDAANFVVLDVDKKVQLLPGAFDGYPSGQVLAVQVTYYSDY